MRRLLLATALSVAAVLPVAAADAGTVTSSNWSGYAAHRSGVHFSTVSGSWRQPAATCTSGTSTSSAFWIGIGGYSTSSAAMEQIGTELDCDTDGTATISAWYELVPSASKTIHLVVHSGDLISARVTVVGKRVTMTFADQTRHESFSKTITASAVDTTSAEWIAEAPSDCASSSSCTTLPLADFGTVKFLNASAQTTGGRTGAISSSMWSTTKLLLGYSTQNTQFVASTTKASAAPTSLSSTGRAFSVAFSGATDTSSTTTSATNSGSTGTDGGSGSDTGGDGSGGSGSGGSGSGGGGPGGGGPGGGPPSRG